MTMTEQEWFAATDPTPMLAFLQGKVSDRKLRLLMVACCRCVLARMPDERCRFGVEVAERWADGTVTDAERTTAVAGTSAVWNETTVGIWEDGWHLHQMARLAHYTLVRRGDLLEDFAHETCVIIGRMLSTNRCEPTAVDVSAHLAGPVQFLHDIIGNPFRPFGTDQSWLTRTVVSLAREMYESRDFSTLPILADALQDAGCENADILNHCRGAGTHVRGCWVIDLLTGRA
jgi:hypothetical protein